MTPRERTRAWPWPPPGGARPRARALAALAMRAPRPAGPAHRRPGLPGSPRWPLCLHATCAVSGRAWRERGRVEHRRQRSGLVSLLSSFSTPPPPPHDPPSSSLHSPPDHRSAHGFSRAAYERGVVIVTCASCASRHLLSDRLGWFGEAGAVDKFLAERGGGGGGGGLVREGAVGPGGTLEISAEDLDGWTARKGA